MMSFDLFGSYFPAWVACLMVGLVVVTLVHVILRQAKMLVAIPLIPIFYILTCVFAGMTTWLVFFSAG